VLGEFKDKLGLCPTCYRHHFCFFKHYVGRFYRIVVSCSCPEILYWFKNFSCLLLWQNNLILTWFWEELQMFLQAFSVLFIIFYSLLHHFHNVFFVKKCNKFIIPVFFSSILTKTTFLSSKKWWK
jgi:hypothetical protein